MLRDSFDLLFSLNVRLSRQTGGARLVFRCGGDPTCRAGYNVLEIQPGSLALSASAEVPNLTDILQERLIRRIEAPVEVERWHAITLWLNGNRIYVYLDRQLIMSAEDTIQPLLTPGAVLLLKTDSAFHRCAGTI